MGDNYYKRDRNLLSTRQKSILNMNKTNYYISSIIKASHAALLIVAIGFVGFAMQSCDNDNDEFPVFPLNRPNALVTLKPTADGSSFYMQLDDSTKINATNIKQAPYGNKEVRAFINFRLLTEPGNKRNYDVYVNWVDSILTKPMVNAGEIGAELVSKGQDPVEILREWTVSEDGYLTIHFRTQWAPNNTPHIVNLVAADPAKPYELTFCHNAQGVKGGYWGDGIVAFRLDKLPDTNGKKVDMTLVWNSFSGKKSVTFKYCSRKGTEKIEGLSFAASGQFERAIK